MMKNHDVPKSGSLTDMSYCLDCGASDHSGNCVPDGHREKRVRLLSSNIPKEAHKTHGYAIDGDDMHWTVACPVCEKEHEYTGFFDSGEMNECGCGCKFFTEMIFVDDEHYVR